MRALDGIHQRRGAVIVSERVRWFGFTATLLATLFGLLFSGLAPPQLRGETGAASASRLWSSGAELNSTTAEVEASGTSGTVSISSSTKRSGDYAYRANPASSTGTFYKTWANSAQSNKFWFRTYLRIADDPSADTYVLQAGNGGSGKISVRLTTTSTLQLRNEEDNTNIGSASSALSANTWYRVEMFVDTTTLSSTDAELRLDGISVSSSTSENLAAGIDRLTWGSATSGTTDLFFDDLAINDSTGRADNWPGEGKLVHMQPDANGDNSAWTRDPSNCNGSSNNYECVDEVTPNDNTDFLRSQTNAQIDDVNLESSSNAGISSGDFIKLVSVGIRIRACGNGTGGPDCIPGDANTNFKVRLKASSGGTVDDATGDIVDADTAWRTNDDDPRALNWLTAFDLPGTSTAPWTTTNLDSAQIGVQNDDSSGIGWRVSTLWLQVEYVPKSGGRLFSSGFELNSTGADVEWSAIVNSPAINSTTVRSGTYSLQTENGGGQEYIRYHFEAANAAGDYYARAYLRIVTGFDASDATVLSLLDTSNSRRAYIRLTASETLTLHDEDGQIGSASGTLSTGVWYRVELRMNTTPSAGSHIVDGRLDGSSFASSSSRSIGTNIARMAIGLHASADAESTVNTVGDLLWDDIALNKNQGTSQNSWPGSGKIVHLKPNASGDFTQWAVCGACSINNHDNVDEVTPNDVSDYNEETTTGEIDDYNIENSSLGVSDTANVLHVGVRFRTSSATQEDFRVRLKDAASGVPIESETLSPASTTWVTNRTAAPYNYPLTAYTRPEQDTAWSDTQLDSAQIGVRDIAGSGTVQVSTIWLLVDYTPVPTIDISGTCDAYDQTTDCTDIGTVKVAVDGVVQAQEDTTVAGTWDILGVTQPASGAVITVWIDAAASMADRAGAVTKYDGTGNITGVQLFKEHLNIGSDDNQTITNADVAAYDNSVASGDDDVFWDVSAGNDLTVDIESQSTQEELFIGAGDVFRPASGGGADVTTVHVEIDGTWTADSNAISVGGSWQNDGTFTAGSSTVTFTSTSTGRTLSGTLTGTNGKFENLTFNGSGGGWSNSSTMQIDSTLTMTDGTLSGTNNVTVSGHVQGTAGIISLTGGTFEHRLLDSSDKNFGTTSGSTTWTFNDLTFSSAAVFDTWQTITTQTGGTGGITVSGIMRVNRDAGANDNDGIRLTGGNRTWTLSGTSGNPLRMNTTDFGGFVGEITPGTSTFNYTGNNGSGNTTVEQNPSGVGYYNLIMNNSSETFVLEGNTGVGNDLTVTNGVLSTTGSNFSLTVTRDLTLANTSGVGLTGNASTITVSRNWNDTGGKFSAGTSTVTLNGTGALDHSNSFTFYNLNLAYSGFTTTMDTSISTRVSNDATLNGGTMTGNSSTLEFPSTTNTPLTFNSPTTMNGTGFNIVSFGSTGSSPTVTVGAGNYGNWNIFFGASVNNTTYSFNGNVTTTAGSRLYAGSATGTSWATNGHGFTASEFRLGSGGATQTVSANFGASAVTFTGTGNTLYPESTGGSYNLNLSSSTVDTKGHILFNNSSGTIAVTPGTSTITWTHTSGTKTYAPNGQSLYNLTLNGSGGTVTPNAAVNVNNNFTITAGTYDTVNGSNYALTVGNNYSNSGTFTARSGTVTFNAIDTGNTLSGTLNGSSAFYNLTFNGSGGGWSNSAAMTVGNDLTLTAGTLSGTNDVTVNGHVTGTAGTTNFTGGTFEQRVATSKNFGTTSGSTAWTFSHLTFSNSSGIGAGITITTQTGGTGNISVNGTLNVGKSGDGAGETTTLNAGNRTWFINNTNGDPFQILASPAGDLTPSTSTFNYTGNNGSGNTTLQSETYCNLTIGPTGASEIYNMEGGVTTSNAASCGNLTITAASIGLNTLDTISGQNYPITIGGNYSNGGTLTARSGTVTFNATDTGNTLSGTMTSPSAFFNLTFNGSGGEWTVNAAATVTDDLTVTNGTVIGTNDIRVDDDLICGASCGSINLTGGTVTLAGTATLGTTGLASNWTFYNLTMGLPSTINFVTAQGTGTITISRVLTIEDSETFQAGDKTYVLAGTTGTPFNRLGLFQAENSTVRYTGENPGGNTTVEADVYKHLEIGCSTFCSGEIYVTNGTLEPNGNLTVNSGATLDVVSGQNYAITLGGNFTNNGTFTARSGTLTLNGSATQTLSGALTGSSAFYNLTVTNNSGASATDCERTGWSPSVDFAAAATVTNIYRITTASVRVEYNSGSTYTFNSINWNSPLPANKIYFRNSAAAGTWLLNVSGLQSAVSYVNVSRSDASSGSTIQAADGTNTNCGNNLNWNFTAPNPPSAPNQQSGSGNAIKAGNWTNETSIIFSAAVSDSESPTTLYLCVEKDILGTNFSNNEDACGAGVIYNGSEIQASVALSGLTANQQYHWQVRVKDGAGFYSGWVCFEGCNANGRDFGIDTSPPSVPGLPSTTSPTTDTTPTWLWSASTDSGAGLNNPAYVLQWSRDKNFLTGVFSSTTNLANYTHLTALTVDTWYFRVKAEDLVGNESEFSKVGSVQINAAPPPPVGGGTTPPAIEQGPPLPSPTPEPELPSVIRRLDEVLTNLVESVPAPPAAVGLAAAIPAVILLVPITTSISIALLAGLPALQYLGLSLLPSLRAPRRWGTVRDRLTSVPIPGVFVDLVSAGTGEHLKRIMTDRTGRFGFLTPLTGQFWVEIKNPLYEPYRSELLSIEAARNQPISFDIYLQPLEVVRSRAVQKLIRYQHFIAGVRTFQLFILVAGSAFSLGLFASQQITEHWLLLALYTLMWALRILGLFSYRQSGEVKDIRQHLPLKEAIVQVTATKGGEERFVHSTMTDEAGRFLVLVPPGHYRLIAAKGGYQPEQREITGEVQNVSIGLMPEGAQGTVGTTPSAPVEATQAAPSYPPGLENDPRLY